jgi:ribonuclease VapC
VASLLRELDVTTVPFTAEHHDVAARAFERYGRGRHKAALNFGDCMSYAVARLADDELLFVGNDFPLTDIDAAR